MAAELAVRWGVVSHVGAVRQVNQDSVLAGPRVFVVADGMGGHASGDIASAIAVSRLATLDATEQIDESTVVAVITEANEEILERGYPGSDSEGMGTTVTGLALLDDPDCNVLVFNVGDSRVYRLAGGSLSQVSVDHSVVAELVRSGRLAAADAGWHPDRNVITRSLGSPEVPEIDRWRLLAEPGERFLICSDGLTNEVADERIAEVLTSGLDPQAAADALLELALDHGARDNVSAVIVETT
jgi:serine/threonine protein phosphatase PrpC